jgi:8-oxo-dGTP diphosphatase
MNDFPIRTVDVVLLTVSKGQLCVLLARRASDPYAGVLAIPGGYVHEEKDDDTLATASRILLTKTGLTAPYLEQLFTFSGKFRDPRGWSISVSYFAMVPLSWLDAVVDGTDLVLVPVDEMCALPFDHNLIVNKAVERVRGKSTYSTLPMFLLPAEFTMADLHRIYVSVLGTDINKVTFRRKIESQDLVEPISKTLISGRHRPSQLYRASAVVLRDLQAPLM